MNDQAIEKPTSWMQKVLKVLLFPFLIMVNPKIYFFDLEEDEGESADKPASEDQAPK